MKFGKNLIRVVELSNPEWGPYWINYKYLKKLINEIVEAHGGPKVSTLPTSSAIPPPNASVSRPDEIAKSSREVQFFSFLRKELKKSGEFFRKAELEYKIRWERIWDAYLMLKDATVIYDKNTWARLLTACVKFYKDVLLLENFAIMNYCGFSKILKKHDKLTGFVTRDAFMKNVVNQQNITRYPDVLELIKKSEQLFRSIQAMETVVPLQAEEKLFIEAIIGLNYQASRMQEEEQQEISNVATSTQTTLQNPTNQSTTSFTVTTKSPPRPPALNVEEAEIQRRHMELGEKLDTATNLLVDAAAKLNHQSDMSPNLTKILSWMELVQAGNTSNPQSVNEKDVNTDQEENDTLVVSGNLLKLNKRQLELPNQPPVSNKEPRIT